MKRKLIGGLILTLFLSFASPISALAIDINNVQALQNINSVQVEGKRNVINQEDFNAFAKSKAEVLVNDEDLIKYGQDSTSVQYAITEGDKVILSDNAGVYSKRENRILTKDNMYGIGSISKMYVTAAVMQLVDEGKVDLDMPLVNYIPEFKTADEDKSYLKMTPRMLINHSSGLMGTNYNNSILNNDTDTQSKDDLLKVLATQRLKAKPGEYSVYCNDGFTLAEILVERVSGKSFTEYVAENISERLNLKGTKTPLDDFNTNRLAKTYLRQEHEMENPVERGMIIGALGMYSTAEENCKFVHAITTDKDDAILSQKSIKAMQEKECLKGMWPYESVDSTLSYGLGWDNVNLYPFSRYGIKALSKGGDTVNYHATVVSLPEYDITMTVLSSGGSSSKNQKFASTVLLEYLKEKGMISLLPDEEIKGLKSEHMPSYLKDYSGEYIFQGLLVDVQINDDGKLEMKLKDVPEGQNLFLTAYHHSGNMANGDAINGDFFIGGKGKNKFALKFANETKNGKKYIEFKKYNNDDYFAQTLTWLYLGQSMDKNEINSDIQKDWNKHVLNSAVKEYYIVNEKYSSALYNTLNNSAIGNVQADIPNGYMGSDKIIDSDNAENAVVIPGDSGRDENDYEFINEDGQEYLKCGSWVALDYAKFGEITKTASNNFSVNIAKNGYSKWFNVKEDMNGKRIRVNNLKDIEGTFIVYSRNENTGKYETINNSYATGRDTVELKEKDIVMFAGKAGTEFKVDILD